MKRSKNYVAAKQKLTGVDYQSLDEIIDAIKEAAKTKFSSSIDLVVKLGLDNAKPEQQLRGAVVLPHNFGKETVVLAITDQVGLAKDAGADYAGGSDLLEKIKNGWMDFDVIVTTPAFMPEIGKLGKILGPKGLVPNVKSGNVGPNIELLVKEFKQGKRKYASDSFGNVHFCVGKIDTPTAYIAENIKSVCGLIKSIRPATVKGEYIQKIVLSSTMGPGVNISLAII